MLTQDDPMSSRVAGTSVSITVSFSLAANMAAVNGGDEAGVGAQL
jgi:hypothetical protein